MGLSSGFESNAIGGMGFGGIGGGGFGGIGLFGLLGLKGIGDLDGRKDCDGEGRDHTLGILAAIANSKDTTVAEGRALAGAICDAEKTNLQQFYAQAIQSANNTQSIKDQATAFAIVADKRFDDLALSGVQQTAAILARINQAEVDNLRDQLEQTRHGLRSKEVEMNITNTNTNVQQQMQQQQQMQMQKDFDIHRRFDSLFSQQAKAGQDIVNIGGLMAGVAQTANPTNVRT